MTRLRLIPVVVVSALATGAAWAATLVVPDQYPTVQSAIVVAASGDSIFVRAGTYTESLILAGKDVSIIGETDGTVLTSAARILELGAGVTSATALERLVFRKGQAPTGAAIYAHDGAGVTIRACRFLNNVARVATGSSSGGAIRVDPLGAATLDSCSFANNTAESATFDLCEGGAVVLGGTARLTATRCRFQDNGAWGFEGGIGGALALGEDVQVEVLDCEFKGNFAGYGGAISAFGGLSVERCRFDGNQGTYGGAAIQNHGYLSAVTIADNVFVGNDAIGAFVIEAHGPGDVRGNTVAFNGPFAGGIDFGGGVHVANNIVVRNGGTGVRCGDALLAFACNDVWSNGSDGTSNYHAGCGDPTGSNGNISENPLFCDPVNRDLHLRPGSPCAPSDPCGRIGALGVNCPLADVPSLPAGRDVRLLAPRPNPATIPVRFAFETARPVTVRLEVLDLAGRRVATPEHRFYDAGRHEVVWHGLTDDRRRVPPGAYVVRLSAGAERDARTFVLTR